MEPSTYFVSDLHMFSRRSQAAAHEQAIHASANRARTFVLGGDIFDFRWSTLGSVETTVRASVDWVDRLVSRNPDCQFHFVAGNHDYNGRFLSAISAYAEQCPNLQFHHYYLRLAGSIFLHGDAADHPTMCASRLESNRQHWLGDETRGPMKHLLYDLAVKARLHRLAGVIHPQRKVAQRLLGYLDRIGHGPGTGLEHVYFGHTHQAMANYELGGLRFHNGGAPMAGLQFRIVEAQDSTESAPPPAQTPVNNPALA
ncbi:metallophosphoesterase [Anatilimnocola sp. NA78]|uniref:metallophosphoesterase n=1 Tax=Anatilimnocola sp. NA78 TaxID=3415683 RepID=UPI003CE4B5AA